MPRIYDYRAMVGKWRNICFSDLPDAEKTEACLSILREFVGDLAIASARAPNPRLRFYSYMTVLGLDVRPGVRSGDELGKLAIYPAYELVARWLSSHAVGC
jgi:hypothetical protein